MTPTKIPTAFLLGDTLFAAAMEAIYAARGRPVLVGLCGAQGSGKSTTAQRLAARLADAGRRVAVCSLDDFYLTRIERAGLAQAVHPLLATRGVPGTHDLDLMNATLDALLSATADRSLRLPLFDKAADDRADPARWPVQQGPVEMVLLEGWCIGAGPQARDALDQPVNRLEEEEDAAGVWRGFVNDQLAGPYAQLFARLDLRLMLRAPDFACVQGWRAEQEAGLSRAAQGARAPMTPTELARFIAHYERITRQLLADPPADLIAELDQQRAPMSWRIGPGGAL